ncbi:MAG: cobyric acid synthase CobQ, partial [Actinobacteria bacterium]|nr:cobyric acid synthase CobQ [Actinomycetota bacterium]
LAQADLVVLPGTRATVADLGWLRSRGLAQALVERTRAGRPLLGICGGYQMLTDSIRDEVESRVGTVEGLGLLPGTVVFGPQKVVGRTLGVAYGAGVRGYEMHHGVVTPAAGVEPFLDGMCSGAVWGTTWHGVLESDEFRRAFLAQVAAAAGVPAPVPSGVSFAAVRERRLDSLADLVANHLDTVGLTRLITTGVPRDLPALRVARESNSVSG